MSDAGFTIHGLFPNFFDGTRVSYSYKSLIEAMAGAGARVESYVLGNFAGPDPHIHALLPKLLYGRTSSLLKRPYDTLIRRFERRFVAGDVAYFWLGNPALACHRLRSRGVTVVREMVNCTFARCVDELARAHAQLGLPFESPDCERVIEQERNDLLAADAVFCPNDGVLESVLAYGVPAENCLRTSYGWSPRRVAGTKRLFAATGGTSFLFAGSGSVRKGLPWLLQAWDGANIDGHLLIAGSIDEGIRSTYARILDRKDVVQLGHVQDIGSAYRSADVFCFPSWEEGGPMVTIEAMGAGLPCIVTRMGAAGILSEDSGGALIVEPGDTVGLVGAMRRLAADRLLRSRFGALNKATSGDYVWERVGERRLQLLRALRDRSGCSGGAVN